MSVDQKTSDLSNGAPLKSSDIWHLARAGADIYVSAKDALAYMARRNFLDNPLFNTCQRPTSGAMGTTGFVVSLDRWVAMQATSAAATVSQQSSFVSNRFKRARVARNAAAGNTGVISFGQALETRDSTLLAGSPVCFAFEGLAGANYSAASGLLNVALVYGTGTDQSSASMLATTWTGYTSLTLNASTAALSSAAWAPFVFTGTLPTTATQVGVVVSFTPVGTAGADDAFYLTNMYLGPGDYPPPAWSFYDDDMDLMRCQRHLPVYNVAGQTGSRFMGYATSTTASNIPLVLPVQPRAPISGVALSANSDWNIQSPKLGTSGALTGVAFGATNASDNPYLVATTTAGSPTLAAGDIAVLAPANGNARIYLTGAEL